MNAAALIEDLHKIHPKGFDLSLERITRLLKRLGNPHLKLPPAIHVAGTNGKGSTIAFCRAALEAAGYSVHVHTSPHLVNWHERFRMGTEGTGRLVEDAILADAVSRVAEANQGEQITVFELLSAVMFVLFSENPADYCLIEVGLGGRFDATNVIEKPIASVIAPIALDHQSYLGETLEKIAFEKAGIIKPGVPVAIGNQVSPALETLLEVADAKRSPVSVAFQDFDYYPAETGFVFQDDAGLLDLPMPILPGVHQLDNAGLAIAAIRSAGIAVSDKAFATAMRTAVWPGRMERVNSGRIWDALSNAGKNPEIWIDGGHNPAAGEAIAAALQALNQKNPAPTLMICGMINTKDPSGFFTPFAGLNVEVFCVPVGMSDASIAPDRLAEIATDCGLKANPLGSLELAVEDAVHRSSNAPATRIFFCGSLYLAGEVMELNGTPPS